jgi:transcriptional regulator with XRE-family HTH domain
MLPGDRIVKRRVELNINQKGLCEITGIPKQTMSRIEKNETEINFERLIAISKALNVSIDWIITGKETDDIDIKFQKLKRSEKELLEPMIDKMLERENKGLSSDSINTENRKSG